MFNAHKGMFLLCALKFFNIEHAFKMMVAGPPQELTDKSYKPLCGALHASMRCWATKKRRSKIVR